MGIMAWAFAMRSDVEISLIEDRNPLFVRLSDGGVRNGYTLKILNKTHEPQRFVVGVDGIAAARMSIVGFDGGELSVDADSLRAVRIYVTVSGGGARNAYWRIDTAPLRRRLTPRAARRSYAPRHSGARSNEHGGDTFSEGARHSGRATCSVRCWRSLPSSSRPTRP